MCFGISQSRRSSTGSYWDYDSDPDLPSRRRPYRSTQHITAEQAQEYRNRPQPGNWHTINGQPRARIIEVQELKGRYVPEYRLGRPM